MTLEMPNEFTEPEQRRESLVMVRTRDVKTGRFVGAPTLIAKNKWLDRLTDTVVTSSDVRALRKKKQKMDPKLSVTLKRRTVDKAAPKIPREAFMRQQQIVRARNELHTAKVIRGEVPSPVAQYKAELKAKGIKHIPYIWPKGRGPQIPGPRVDR